MSQRDELAGLIDLITNRFDNEVTDPWLWSLADAIRAAGYRKPRTIETVEELDALPEDSIVQIRRLAYQKLGNEWFSAGDRLSFEASELAEFGSSPRVQPGIVVLYVPEETQR
ncbi:hypothetical protein QNA24_30020 [Rhodococcus qingshengii]|uniref:hypothetical protein n=1 Tax=Rhodococcus TaxID=1827 RepID=UPI001E44BFA0|nr:MULTISPECIES: hypothetical protein [Rhodococcus]MCD2099607.1 hypothetical protein [Rhodococcus rhodochrous]MCD2123975.1 hypothetical protein [Rhodococcus rhodochrous]MCQ4136593.1 hypothetical protein [Rhodococcus rhodochrous]MDJ0490621.1 hypothetical protein [Rhodococcus qingshengii]